MEGYKRTNTFLSILVGALLATLVLTTGGGLAAPMQLEAPQVITPRLHFQGRLLDPATGASKSDGAYPMTFAIYNTASGGAPLWTETKDVTVSSDPQIAPRQPLAFVPYAIFSSDAIHSDFSDEAVTAGFA